MDDGQMNNTNGMPENQDFNQSYSAPSQPSDSNENPPQQANQSPYGSYQQPPQYAPPPPQGNPYAPPQGNPYQPQGNPYQQGNPYSNYQQPPQYTPNPAYTPPQPKVPQPGRGMGIGAMVCGIVSLVFCWAFYIGLPCAIVALILGIISRKKDNKNGMALAGIIMGSIGIALGVIILVVIIGALSIWGSSFESYYDSLPDMATSMRAIL